jgi:hypothetical protein
MRMRFALLTGAAALLSLIGTAAASAETFYVNEPAVVTTTPGTVTAVPAPPFGPFTPRYIVSEPTVMVSPSATIASPSVSVAPRERVIERERVVITPRKAAAPRERVVERERVVVDPGPQVVVAPREAEIVTTGSSTRSCFIDLNGFERCY